jgi:hypothetical protein
MKNRIIWILGAAMVMLVANVCAREITPEQAPALMEECQNQRQQEIAPLKAQAIDDCINVQRKDEAYCERFNATYGQGGTTASGGRRPGMFWDLPVCVDALEAERYFRINPGRTTFNTGG